MAATYTRYGDIIIRDYLGPPADEEIEELEKMLGSALPQSFREFLHVANGGNMDCYYVDVAHPDMEVPRSFSMLYGTRERMAGSPFGLFSHEIELSREAAQLPREVLPFARDNSGCELYLDLTDFASMGEDRVVAFIHGLPGQENQPGNNAWVTIALHFDDFIRQLKIEEVYCLEVLEEASKGGPEHEERLVAMIDFLDQALPDWRKREKYAPYSKLPGALRH
jgi:hypothetical protein